MNFFERILHISPDGGSGATEATYILAVIVLILALGLSRQVARQSRR